MRIKNILFITFLYTQSLNIFCFDKCIDHNVIKIIFRMYAQKYKRGKDLMPYRLVCKKWKIMVDEIANWDYFVRPEFRFQGEATKFACIHNRQALVTKEDIYQKLRDFRVDGKILSMNEIENLVEEINHNSFFNGHKPGIDHFYLIYIQNHAYFKKYYRLIKAIIMASGTKNERARYIAQFQPMYSEISLKKLCNTADKEERKALNNFRHEKCAKYNKNCYFYE